MTTLLEKAVDQISKLPSNEQDEIAKIILDEIEDEKTWYDKFKNSQGEESPALFRDSDGKHNLLKYELHLLTSLKNRRGLDGFYN